MKFVSHKRIKKRNKLLILAIIGSTLLVLALVGAIGARSWYSHQLKPISLQSRTELVEIKKGTTANEIADLLQEKRLIRSSTAFVLYLKNNDLRDSLQAGTYEIDASRSVQEIVGQIAGGKVQKNLFTILPGQRLDQIKTAMLKAGFSEQSVNDAFNQDQYKNHPALIGKPPEANLEGYLFPDSFQTTSSTTPKQIIEQSLDAMAKALTPELIDSFTKNGLTTHQAIILASIVDKEVSDSAQKPIVASVFYNRLKIGMVLGSDVTYQYIAKILGIPPSADIESPYNTRKFKGLPPGPISNVSKTGLKAVSEPASTDFLFFVAGDDGKVYYSKTIQEHEALAREHCKVLCSTY